MQGTARALLVIASLSLAAAGSAAQGTIRGTLIDSLRGGTLVAGAEVVVRGAPQRARTDARGRFELTGLPAGEHTLAFHAPWLDSLGLTALERRVRIPGAGEVVHVWLATPTPQDYARARCGTALDETQGILHGEISGVDGRPLDGIPVAARWIETHIGQGRLDRYAVATADTSTESGAFLLCGVPVDAVVTLVAGDSAYGPAEVQVAMPDAFLRRRDLVIGAADGRVRVTGRVEGPGGTPLAGAIIEVVGDSARRARADSAGSFVLAALPLRSAQLQVRAVGHEPARLDLDPRGTAVELPVVTLRRAARELSRVTITTEVMARRRAEFEERRMSNPGGRFIPDEELAKLPVITATAVAAMVHRSRAAGSTIMLEFNGVYCHPIVYVDGLRIGRVGSGLDGVEVARWLQLAKRIEMYRAAFTPAQYVDFAGCGAILIWTE